MSQDWKTISSKEIHRNPWYRLMEDEMIMPSGQQGKYTYIDRFTTVIIAAVDQDEKLQLVGQYRYPIKNFSWELPMGALEKSDEDLLDAAKRELLEEVGLEATDWQQVGEIYLSTSLSNQKGVLFLARNLKQKQAMPDYTEFITAKKLTFDEIQKLIDSNEIVDSHSIACFYKIKNFLKK